MYAAFLRGINVGGNTPVSMPELKACFEHMGMTHVSTYINSGNVAFGSDQHDTRALEKRIEKALHEQFSYDIKVVVRSFGEIETILANAPKGWEGDTEHRLNIIFLRHEIDTPDIVEQLTPRTGVDEVSYAPGVVFWSTVLSGLSKSRMTKIIGTPIYKDMTVRTYGTLKKVFALMQAGQA